MSSYFFTVWLNWAKKKMYVATMYKFVDKGWEKKNSVVKKEWVPGPLRLYPRSATEFI